MGEIKARGGMRQQTISAVVTRADGTVENLGVISYWHKNPVMRLWFKLRRMLGVVH